MSGTPEGWPTGGVHRVVGPADRVAAELADRGWDVALVPPARAEDALWDGFVEALGLPGWFGRNLDALEEALRDLTRPTALVLARWSVFARTHPERWARFLAVLRQRAVEDGSPFLVVLAD